MDYIIAKWINGLAGKFIWLDVIGIIFSDFLILVIPLIIILVYFFSKKRSRTGIIIGKIILGLVLVILLNYALSQIIARPRPFVVHKDIYQLAKFIIGPNDFSFPSDHTAMAFVMAIVVFVDWKKFGLILLISAFLVAVGRIFVGVHYPLDILAGIIMAAFAVYTVEYVLKRFKT